MTLTLRYAVRSDRGLVRGNNEDSVYAGPRLLAIADGMGGHAAGEVASKIVISSLEPLDEDRPVGDLLAELRTAVERANGQIADEAARDSELDGMGTTLTALRFSGAQIGVVHVGDSRAYLMRGDHLAQITHDDTYVQSLVDQGRLTADEAANHPRKSVILRALTGSAVDPDVSIREAREGDRYLLCTDGLSDVVSAQTLYETLAEGDPQECADRLVELALRGGGPDNVTCIVADVVSTGYGDEVPVIGGAFVDPPGPAERSADSPAERAARIIESSAPAGAATPPAAAGRSYRPWIIAAVAVVAVVVAMVGAYAWTQSQYFVGKDGDEVAVFRGVDTQFGPLKFFSVKVHEDLRVDTLTEAARSQLDGGIDADSQPDAERIVARLRDEQLPLCSSLVPLPTPTPTLTPGGATHPSSPVASSPAASSPVVSSPVVSSPVVSSSPATSATLTPAAPTPSKGACR